MLNVKPNHIDICPQSSQTFTTGGFAVAWISGMIVLHSNHTLRP